MLILVGLGHLVAVPVRLGRVPQGHLHLTGRYTLMSAEDCSLQTRNLSSKEQIWLPGLQVWAAVGSMRADTSANCGKNPRSVVVAGPSASVNIQTKAEVPLVTEAPVKAATLASDASTCVTQEAEIVPTCPICKHNRCPPVTLSYHVEQFCTSCFLQVSWISPVFPTKQWSTAACMSSASNAYLVGLLERGSVRCAR